MNNYNDLNLSNYRHNTSRRYVASLLAAASLVMLTFGLNASPAQAAINFVEQTTLSNFDDTESWGASWGDMNGDLWPDLFVVNHRNRSSIFRNNGDGTFTNTILQADLSKTWLNGPLIDTHGAAFADFDRDGDEDLVQQTGFCCDAMVMVNDGTGHFTDQVTTYGMGDDREGRTPQWWDFDLDGTLDLMVASGSMRLWKNELVPTTPPFPNVAPTTSLNNLCWTNQWGILTDMDGDDNMEYICAAEGNFPQRTLNYVAPNFEVNSYLPTNTIAHALDAAVADFDGDLRPDIFLTRGNIMPTQAKLVDVNGVNSRIEAWLTTGFQNGYRTITFRADGPLTIDAFSNQVAYHYKVFLGANGVLAADDGGSPSATQFTVDPANTNHHGLLYNTPGFDPDTSAARGTYVGYDPVTDLWTLTIVPGENSSRGYYVVNNDSGNALTDLTLTGALPQDAPIIGGLLMNNGTGFTDEWFSRMSPFSPQRCVSVASGDFDNDMDLDLYLVCRGGVENIANRLFENDGAGNFSEVTGFGAEGLIGVGLASKAGTGENAIMADYDVDGQLDLFVTNGLVMQPFLVGAQDQMFRNNTNNGNHWVQIELEGVASNIEGIGAKLFITTDAGGANEKTQLREQNGGMHRWSQNHQRIHVGLGSHTTFDVTVHWPSGTVDTHTGVAADKLYEITEGDTNPPVELIPGAAVSDPALVAGNECGQPAYLPKYDSGVFLWKDCANTGEWRLDVVGGDSTTPVNQSGKVYSDMALTGVTGISLEGLDTLDDSVSGVITYGLTASAGGLDAFTFSTSTGSTSCLVLNNPNVPLYLGTSHIRATGPLNLDDVSQPCILLSTSDVTVSEDDGTADVQVSLSAASTSNVTVQVGFIDGSAMDGSDFTASSQTVTFLAGSTSETVSIPLIDDLISEPTEAFTVELSGANGATIGTSSATITIVDDEAGPCGAPTINAASEKALFIWHECGTDQWHARATAGVDSGVQHMGTLTSNNSFTSVAPISFEGNDVMNHTGNQIDFNVFMSSPGFDQIDFSVANGSAICVNTANTAIPVLVGENKIPVTTQVDINALNACPALTIGTSVPGPFGDATTHLSGLFATFDQQSFDLMLSFDAFDVDNASEVSVYLNGQLLGSVPALNAATQSVSMMIPAASQIAGLNMLEFRHNDPTDTWAIENLLLTAPATIDAVDVAVAESVGTAVVTVNISSAAPTGGVSVDVDTIDNSAVAPGDYLPLTSQNLVIAAGNTSGSVNLTINNDTLPETVETFHVSLSNPVGGVLGDDLAIVTITDDDVANQCGKPTYTPGGSTPVIALWQNCDPTSANYLKWNLEMADGADAGNTPSDYSGSLTANPSTAFVSMTPISFEGIDSLSNAAGVASFVSRMNGNGTDGLLFVPASGTLTCLDFSVSPVTNVLVGSAGTSVSLPFNIEDLSSCVGYELSVADSVVNESTGTTSVTVSASSAPTSAITVDFIVTDGSATSPADYTDVTGSSTLTIAAGQTTAAVQLDIVDDNVAESNETLTVTLSNPSGATINDGTAVVTITDNDAANQCGKPTFAPGGATPVIALWKNCTTGEWSLEMSDGAGNGPSDYTGSLQADSSTNFASASTVSFEGIDNLNGVTYHGSIPPTDLLNFTTRMNGAGTDIVKFTPATGTNTCLDFSVSPVTTVLVGASNTVVSFPFDIDSLGGCSASIPALSVGNVSVTESDGTANVVVSLNTPASSTVTVDLATSDGTANAPDDYATLSTTATINAGASQVTVPVTINGDFLPETTESFTVTLSNPSGATISTATGVVTITDDDDAQCGKPTFTPGGASPTVALWKDCSVGIWKLEMSDGADPGNTPSDYTGSLTSSPLTNFGSAVTISFEGIDNVNGVTNNGVIPAASVLNFITRMNGAGIDILQFTPASGTDTCLDLPVSAAANVLVGSSNLQVTPPFDIETLGACQ